MASGELLIGHELDDLEELTSRALDETWDRVQARLEKGLRRIEQLTAVLFDRSLEPFEVEAAVELCQLTAIKVDALGFGQASDLLRDAAIELQSANLGPTNAVTLASSLDDARTIIATTVAEIKHVPRLSAPLAVVGPISEDLDELVWSAFAQGLSVVRHIDGVDKSAPTPSAILAVVDGSELEQARPLLRSMREIYPLKPFVLVAPAGTVSDRAAAAEWVTTILSDDTKPGDVILEVRREVARQGFTPTVAVLGDYAPEAAAALVERGLEASAVSTPEALIELLRSEHARAAVLTPTDDALTNENLVHVIRSDRATRRATTIVIGNDDHPGDILRAGADWYFGGSLQPDDLAAAVKALLRRRALLEPVRNVIGERSLQAWSMATVLIERLLLSAFRQNQPVGVGLITLPLGVDNDGTIDPLADEIAREFRSEDVIARYSPDLLVIVLRGASRQVLTRRLEQVHHKYGLNDLNVRSASVSFPADGRSLEELVEVGQAALDRASSEDSLRIVRADWRDSEAETPDVMLIDPDRNLGDVLVGTLVRRGLNVVHYRQALDAMDDLTRPGGPPLPRVVLMELDQRGLDGLQMLRQLREAGGLGRYRVVVLATRSREMELQRAFELGAYDYVTKPFSAPLLIHRLSRALEA